MTLNEERKKEGETEIREQEKEAGWWLLLVTRSKGV